MIHRLICTQGFWKKVKNKKILSLFAFYYMQKLATNCDYFPMLLAYLFGKFYSLISVYFAEAVYTFYVAQSYKTFRRLFRRLA